MAMHILTTEEKKEVSLEALLRFHTFCIENDLSYYLAYGTLIGAVRHNGFIPWDDDVDVMMPRHDYERFLRIFVNDSHFRAISSENDKMYMLPYAKVLNERTSRLIGNGIPDSIGIGIDIFPIDGIPEDIKAAEKLFQKQNRLFLQIVNRFAYYLTLPDDTLLSRCKRTAGQIMLHTGLLKKSAIRCSHSPFEVAYGETGTVAVLTGVYSGVFRTFDIKCFRPVEHVFEGHSFIVPEGYDTILRTIYGDYMQMPPEDQRVSTHEESFVWRD